MTQSTPISSAHVVGASSTQSRPQMPGSGSGSAGGIVSVDPRTPQSTLVAGGGAPRAKADEGDSFIHDPRPKVKVSIVLPCYNEQDHVLAEVQRITESMDTSGFSYEILAIDDKSTDNTLQVLTDAKPQYPHMYVVPFPRNGGSGTARRIGSAIARGDIVVWTDADMSYPNERIPEFVTYLDENPACDQVVGARTTEEGTHKLLRVPAKLVIRKFAESLSSTKIPDLNSGLRAFRRDVSLPYLRLLPPGFSCVTTLTLSFLSNQHQVDYLPIKYSSRAGSSKFHPLRDAYRYIMQVLRMTMYFNPMKVLMPLALTLLAFGVVKSGYDVISDPFALSMNAILIVLSGLIIGSMALLADLIVRSRND